MGFALNTDMDRQPHNAILIVEDNEDIRDTFRTLFELEGFDVQLAENGQAALRRLDDARADTPCLILLDLSMPVMDGWQFLDALRQREHGGPQIPVTVLSANVDATVSRDLKSRYGCRVLRKPASIDTLLGIARGCREDDSHPDDDVPPLQ